MSAVSNLAPPRGNGTVLRRALTTRHVWGLGVGLVISGEYFGWNYGWPVAGTLGFMATTLGVVLLYVTFTLSLAELGVRVPEAGGVFAYARHAFGAWGGVVAGAASLVEFLFAPPAIAYALGGYLHVLHPSVDARKAALVGLALFGIVNLSGVRTSARLELVVTTVAVLELLAFVAVVLPHFEARHFLQDAWPEHPSALFDAVPYAVWLFLGIEGVVMVAEEVKAPDRTLPRGILLAIGTLVALAVLVMLAAGGVGDWRMLTTTDFPVPGAVAMALGPSPWVKAFAGLGLFGLIASLHGIVLSAGRQLFAVARAGYLPAVLARPNRFGTPAHAVVCCTLFGLAAIVSGRTDELIVLAGMGAVTLYGIAVLALFRLRAREREEAGGARDGVAQGSRALAGAGAHSGPAARPGLDLQACSPVGEETAVQYRVPFYPWVPVLALALSLVALGAMVHAKPVLGLIFAALLAAFSAAGAVAPRFRAR